MTTVPAIGAIASAQSKPALSTEDVTRAAKKAGRDFEAMFVSRMLDSMFSGVGTGKMFGGGEAEKQWRGFMNEEYGKSIAQSGSLGISKMVESEVARLYREQAEGNGA